MAFDLIFVQYRGEDKSCHILDNFVPDTLSLSEGKWLKMLWFLEGIVFNKSFGIIFLRMIPIISIEVHEMVVDKYYCVGRNIVA